MATCYIPLVNLWFSSSDANKYVLLAINGDHKDEKPTILLITKITKLEKLQDLKNYKIIDWNLKIMWDPTSGANLSNKKKLRRSSNLEINVLWFSQKENIFAQIQKRWFGPFMVQYYLPNNIVLLISINNFEPNLILVIVN